MKTLRYIYERIPMFCMILSAMFGASFVYSYFTLSRHVNVPDGVDSFSYPFFYKITVSLGLAIILGICFGIGMSILYYALKALVKFLLMKFNIKNKEDEQKEP